MDVSKVTTGGKSYQAVLKTPNFNDYNTSGEWSLQKEELFDSFKKEAENQADAKYANSIERGILKMPVESPAFAKKGGFKEALEKCANSLKHLKK